MFLKSIMVKSKESPKKLKRTKTRSSVERPGTKTVEPQGHFGEYVQSVIDKKNFSQSEVSRRGGIDTGNLTTMIGGSKRNPEFNTIRKLAVGLGEPYLRVCAALLSKEEQERESVKEYWFDERLMLIDDILSQLSPLERGRHEAMIDSLIYSVMKSYKEQAAETKRKQLEG